MFHKVLVFQETDSWLNKEIFCEGTCLSYSISYAIHTLPSAQDRRESKKIARKIIRNSRIKLSATFYIKIEDSKVLLKIQFPLLYHKFLLLLNLKFLFFCFFYVFFCIFKMSITYTCNYQLLHMCPHFFTCAHTFSHVPTLLHMCPHFYSISSRLFNGHFFLFILFCCHFKNSPKQSCLFLTFEFLKVKL
jgi:hypothetical protein